MAELVLLRHGESQWNLENRFTGWVDVPLSPRGEAARRFGAEQVRLWRGSYGVRPPGGESLADTAARVLPYWETHLLPELRAGRNLLVVAHGNSLRALVMHLDRLTPAEVLALEIPTGAPLLYEIGPDGAVRGKRYL